MIDQSAPLSITATAGTISLSQIKPLHNLITRDKSSYRFELAVEHNIPLDGSLEIAFPSEFDFSLSQTSLNF